MQSIRLQFFYSFDNIMLRYDEFTPKDMHYANLWMKYYFCFSKSKIIKKINATIIMLLAYLYHFFLYLKWKKNSANVKTWSIVRKPLKRNTSIPSRKSLRYANQQSVALRLAWLSGWVVTLDGSIVTKPCVNNGDLRTSKWMNNPLLQLTNVLK